MLVQEAAEDRYQRWRRKLWDKDGVGGSTEVRARNCCVGGEGGEVDPGDSGFRMPESLVSQTPLSPFGAPADELLLLERHHDVRRLRRRREPVVAEERFDLQHSEIAAG